MQSSTTTKGLGAQEAVDRGKFLQVMSLPKAASKSSRDQRSRDRTAERRGPFGSPLHEIMRVWKGTPSSCTTSTRSETRVLQTSTARASSASTVFTGSVIAGRHILVEQDSAASVTNPVARPFVQPVSTIVTGPLEWSTCSNICSNVGALCCSLDLTLSKKSQKPDIGLTLVVCLGLLLPDRPANPVRWPASGNGW